ncbi:endoplasmic reticulum metallopeptidase 1-like [Rhagoletis pomonella]|uniref:endoplasmic reticulum metallopeptidase 1-like n=1 Tax=Rhagoletis pomonella TaxID=28610 RepID=UPI0017864447|nr:endoplasmic reticulum metallopeptidase 1-like [Rhagoletis pomonella]XP_036344806.1 endoplasmic reticulum metallopeptidase 1-like [Rhagoletis pomonella]
MYFKSKYHIDVDFEVPKKLNWYYAPVFTAFWMIIYFSIVITQVNRLPTPLTRKDELTHPDAYIAERAEQILINLSRIGPKVVGSEANEVKAVEFIVGELNKVKEQMSDYFELEIDVQVATGSYVHWTMLNMYQGIQNVVAKLSEKNNTSSNYLLMNSHFDSAPGSPGASDDGSMVSTMLEVLRVIAKSDGPLAHPIVFLFNGAEENPLQASHGFITQHKWAQNCKALINLDSAGSGGREVLFQSGPGNPWLMNYYRRVPHPFASTLAEELFQNNFIPSDTDFRIFRDYGGVPGLDMAYIFNGYVYHTEFDRFNVLAKGSLQNTGDNVLSLARSIANAPEMDNPTGYESGTVIFYDFIGWFILYYSINTSIIINGIACLGAIVAIFLSLYFMSARSGLGWLAIGRRYALSFAVQVLGLSLGAVWVIIIAVFMDGVGRSETWFSNTWLIYGLYFCPMFFCMGIFPAMFLERTKKDLLSLGFRIQLFMHSHCLILVLLTIILTALSVRSAYMCMMAVFFDIAALIINLITKWHRRAYWFAITVIICQILPFIYYTSTAYTNLASMIPMVGRSGSGTNPDLLIAAIAIFFSCLFAGFLMPLYLFFRKTRTIMLCFLGVTILFIVLAVTPVGFPYTPKVATQRYSLLHANRILYNADGTARVNESGIYIFPQDRRIHEVDDIINSIGVKQQVGDICNDEIFCGMPLLNHRWHKARETSFWITIDEQPNIPSDKPLLTLTSQTALDTANTQRYNFTLAGPDHMAIYIGPKASNKIVNWSFNETMLGDSWSPPFFIYYSYGKDSSALEFFIDLEVLADNSTTENLEIGIVGHWIHQTNTRPDEYEKFIQSFPDYAFVVDWVATYESWLF